MANTSEKSETHSQGTSSICALVSFWYFFFLLIITYLKVPTYFPTLSPPTPQLLFEGAGLCDFLLFLPPTKKCTTRRSDLGRVAETKFFHTRLSRYFHICIAITRCQALALSGRCAASFNYGAVKKACSAYVLFEKLNVPIVGGTAYKMAIRTHGTQRVAVK